MKLTETFFIGGEAYTLRYYNGTHEVILNGSVVFTGWYEKCRAFLKDREVAHLESRFYRL